MPKLASILKFALLTLWIVFVSLTAQIFYAPDVFLQQKMVDACLRPNAEKVPIKTGGFQESYLDSTGGAHTVYINTWADGVHSSALCMFDRDGNLMQVL